MLQTLVRFFVAKMLTSYIFLYLELMYDTLSLILWTPTSRKLIGFSMTQSYTKESEMYFGVWRFWGKWDYYNYKEGFQTSILGFQGFEETDMIFKK